LTNNTTLATSYRELSDLGAMLPGEM
jgi:hypothetical protein